MLYEAEQAMPLHTQNSMHTNSRGIAQSLNDPPKENLSSMSEVSISVRREPDTLDLPLPRYASLGAAGMDLHAAIPGDFPVTLQPNERAVISTGIRLALPSGYEAQIRPRSGLAAKYGIGMVNAPGTIDSDYRGVIQVILVNWGNVPFVIRRGDRIGQMVIAPVTQALLIEVEELDATERNEGGFGSTGTKL